MVLAGFGITLAPVALLRPFVGTGELERVLPRFARRSAPVHVLWPSRRFEPAAVALFREALAKALPRTLAGDDRTTR
jgi:DNA-binding transcriptional LysR family regulator